MGLVRAALRRPVTTLVLVIAIALCAILAIRRMRADIFPNLNLPVIYVAQPYGGMSPAQMDGYIVYYYGYHFLYINGIESVESKSIQGNGLLKLTFYPGTNMSEALTQTVSYVNRAHAFMPTGTVPPFVIRFDAGTVPVGYLVFSSPTRSVGQLQDLALNQVRPLFATLPGVSAPPPFGGNQRTIVISVDPNRLRAYNLSPDDVVHAISSGNVLQPAGGVRTGSLLRIVTNNAVVSSIQSLDNLPIRAGAGPTVLLHDVATVTDSTDVPTGYALVNGRRAIYLPVTKRPDASTLTVVNEVEGSLPRFRAVLPPDVGVSYEFDQSGYVRNSLLSVVREGLFGALLAGLMVLVFLRDWRSSLIVVITIPFALLTAIVALWFTGQTINIMTLGGLALAVGILVDEATVVIENIHTHLARGQKPARAILHAGSEVVIPNLLAMLAVVAVFVPSFFMTGVTRSLFIPLSLAVAFAMAASFFLSSSLVPVLSAWRVRAPASPAVQGARKEGPDFEALRNKWGALLEKLVPYRRLLVAAYLVASLVILALLGPRLGQQLFPTVSANTIRLRFDAPVGTRAEDTEKLVQKVLQDVEQEAGPGNLAGSLGYVGTQGASYPINSVFLWTNGPQEAVINIALRAQAGIDLSSFEERLRKMLPPRFPGCNLSFDPADLVSQIMNFGAPAPVEVAVYGPGLAAARSYAERLRDELGGAAALRDLEFEQPLDYPSVNVRIDRELAGQMGVSVGQVGRSLAEATASSRFTTPVFWADPRTGIGFQMQVQYPQPKITSLQDIQEIPVMAGDAPHPLLGDVATVTEGTIPGEIDRLNSQPLLTLSANIAGRDLGRAAREIEGAIERAGTPPRGIRVEVRGQIAAMRETFAELGVGLVVAIIAIFLLLAANFESLRLSFVVLSIAPAAICGAVFLLLATRTSLNLESFMGAIMAIGVATANAILLVTFAEQYRRSGSSAVSAAIQATKTRLRPILMTSGAMIAGMIPMALAIGSGAEGTAPLGRAVIGGLLVATLINLTVLPFVFAMVQGRASALPPSLDPDDPSSRYAVAGAPGPAEGGNA